MTVSRQKFAIVAVVVALFLLIFPFIVLVVFSLYAKGKVVAAWLTLLVCGLALALFTTVSICRWLVWPLIALSDRVRKVAQDSTLTTRIFIPEKGNRDVAAIGTSMNSFLDLLAQREQELRNANEALACSERRYRNLFDNAFDVVFVLDDQEKILEMNEAGVKLLGYESFNEMNEVLPCLFNDNPGNMALLMESLSAEGFLREHEISLKRKDGTVVPGQLSVTMLHERVGGYSICGYFRDLTRQREIERQMVHVKKMEVAAVLADGLSHEFNTVLTTIIGYGEIIDKKLPQDNPLKQYVTSLLRTGRAGAYFTKNLLRYKRESTFPSKRFLLEDLLSDLRAVPERIGENIEVIIPPAAAELQIMGDRHYIFQVLLNLYYNARDAMSATGGTLTIATELINLLTETTQKHNCEPGPYVSVSVADTGNGIDPRNMPKIFDPFFTTKEVGKGTGLGLTMVYTIVKEHGGFITVDSEEGNGTTFTVNLPHAQDTQMTPPASSVAC